MSELGMEVVKTDSPAATPAASTSTTRSTKRSSAKRSAARRSSTTTVTPAEATVVKGDPQSATDIQIRELTLQVHELASFKAEALAARDTIERLTADLDASETARIQAERTAAAAANANA